MYPSIEPSVILVKRRSAYTFSLNLKSRNVCFKMGLVLYLNKTFFRMKRLHTLNNDTLFCTLLILKKNGFLKTMM